MCGFFLLAIPTGSCFSCQKLIEGLTRPKFERLLKYFMLALAGQCRVYAASIYIYIYIYMYVYVYIYLYILLLLLLLLSVWGKIVFIALKRTMEVGGAL